MIPTEPYAYLKEHLGCKYSIAEFGIHHRKWSKDPTLKETDLWNTQINCCQELPSELTYESDYINKIKNKENQDYAEKKLQELGVGYCVSSHEGKSDYIRHRFKTSQQITPEIRLAVIRFFAKPGLKFDENFKSLNCVRPVPGRIHWKHSYKIEKVIKVIPGKDLDIDKLGIIIKTRRKKTFASKIAQRVSISKLARELGINDCPNCHQAINFKDDEGLFCCQDYHCNFKGNIVKFVARCKYG